MSPVTSRQQQPVPLHDTLNRLKAEVGELRVALDRLRVQSDRQMQQLKDELNEEKRARQWLQEEFEQLKKAVLAARV
jgi:NTP pyrophosphatase (non-canonical NTP hydrolase)